MVVGSNPIRPASYSQEKMEENEQFDIAEHMLVPKHVKITQEELNKVLDHYNITVDQLPQIHLKDPAIEKLEPQLGDVIKIIRKSPTTGETAFYRVVVHG